MEWDGSRITLDSLDSRKGYPKLEPIEGKVKVSISEEGQVTQIGSLLNVD